MTSGPDVQPADVQPDEAQLLGLVAFLQHAAFTRLAADAADAPELTLALELTRHAATAGVGRDRVLDHLAARGRDPLAAMGEFVGLLDDFEERTVPSTWWERVLRGYVGYGVAEDFCRLAAEGLTGDSREVVLGVVGDLGGSELAAAALQRAAEEDEVLASRLALWGRRLVGEALAVVQRELAGRPGLARLAAGEDGDAAPLLSRLTAEHTRRMGRLGLAA